MTDLDIEDIKAKAKAAPPGPWRVESETTLIWGKCDPEDNTTYGMGIPLAEVKPHPGWGARQGLPADEAEAAAHFIAAANPSVVLALIDRVEKAEAMIAKAAKNSPVYKAVEKILDEHSAWIARPNRKVTEMIALAAVISADLETGASHVLGELHERCDAIEAENSRLRAILARAGEALKPFHLLDPFEAQGWADERGWTDLAPKNERICDWFGPTDFRDVVTVASEISEALGHD